VAAPPQVQSSLALEPGRPGRLEAWAPQDWAVCDDWRDTVNAFFGSDAGQALGDFIRGRLAAGATIYPPQPLRALELTPASRVHAVVLGQDPYHGAGQAEGLAFSVAPGVKPPPSLRNIFKELGQAPASASLAGWAQRGVLLLNACLTVEDGCPGSHAGRGWEALTDALLRQVAAAASPCAYLLWGAHAQAKAGLIESVAASSGRQALVLQANHPSPLSANRPPKPFLGCGHFREASQWLHEHGCAHVFDL
jgi:uracil-DNA glycosylase